MYRYIVTSGSWSSSWSSSRRSGRELDRVALPTVQRRLALSGKLCFNSFWPVTNVTGQGNGLRSWIVREKGGGPGITVKAKKKKKKQFSFNSVNCSSILIISILINL